MDRRAIEAQVRKESCVTSPIRFIAKKRPRALRTDPLAQWSDLPPLWREGTAYANTGKSARPGLYKCKDCRKQFTVKQGTVFERSRVPLNMWLLAVHLITSSKKGYPARHLHRSLADTQKNAWFMAHRIRHAISGVKRMINPPTWLFGHVGRR